MARSDVVPENEFYSCFSLSEMDADDARDISFFEAVNPKGEGLANYLQYVAWPDELMGHMRTYLVRDKITGELAGYFSLKAGLVSTNERVVGDAQEFDTVPGIELANFAVNAAYRRKHPDVKGLGRVIFMTMILPMVRKVAEMVGVAMIYIFSLPVGRVIENYMTYGFERLSENNEKLLHERLKPSYDEGCVFMYMAI